MNVSLLQTVLAGGFGVGICSVSGGVGFPTTTSQALARVIHPKCRRCSKHSPVEEFVAGGPLTGYCLRCYERHGEALDLLTNGTMPRGCHGCNLTMGDLMASSPGADVRVYLHLKDGIYQLLCKTCSDDYELKRADLYRQTPYGTLKKI
jgi:hypothetical protein